MQSERRYIISQLIGTIWCAVCEFPQRGNVQVEYAGISIDKKLNQTWNWTSIKVTYRVSIFQLKAIQLFNCSIRGKNGYTKWRHKNDMQKNNNLYI